VVWAGGLAHDVPDDVLRAALSNAQVTLVRGEHDTLMTDPQGTQLHTRLQQLSPAAEYVKFDGAHHLERTVLAPLLTRLSQAP
jgi:predicted esterase